MKTEIFCAAQAQPQKFPFVLIGVVILALGLFAIQADSVFGELGVRGQRV